MAKAKFDMKTLDIPAVATKPIYAGVGVTDLAVEVVRDYVSDVQKRFVDVQKTVTDFDFEPKALREQAVTVVSARRAAVEARVADLQSDAKAAVNDNVSTVTDTYADLAKRGEVLVGRIRKQESTKATVRSAETTSAKAKTTKTQATKSAKTTAKSARSSAKRTATSARKSSTAGRSSGKATATAAKKTASNAAKATTDAAAKVGN